MTSIDKLVDIDIAIVMWCNNYYGTGKKASIISGFLLVFYRIILIGMCIIIMALSGMGVGWVANYFA